MRARVRVARVQPTQWAGGVRGGITPRCPVAPGHGPRTIPSFVRCAATRHGSAGAPVAGSAGRRARFGVHSGRDLTRAWIPPFHLSPKTKRSWESAAQRRPRHSVRGVFANPPWRLASEHARAAVMWVWAARSVNTNEGRFGARAHRPCRQRNGGPARPPPVDASHRRRRQRRRRQRRRLQRRRRRWRPDRPTWPARCLPLPETALRRAPAYPPSPPPSRWRAAFRGLLWVAPKVSAASACALPLLRTTSMLRRGWHKRPVRKAG